MKMVGVEMQDVEPVGLLPHHLNLQHGMRQRIGSRRIQPQRLARTGDEPGPGLRVPAREQRHVVAHRDQLVGQPRHHSLGTAVELGRHALGQWGDLGDAHAGLHRARPSLPMTLAQAPVANSKTADVLGRSATWIPAAYDVSKGGTSRGPGM